MSASAQRNMIIWARRVGGHPLRELAAEFQLSPATISRIADRERRLRLGLPPHPRGRARRPRRTG